MKKLAAASAFLLAASCAMLPREVTSADIPPPVVAAHQHLISPAFSKEVLHGEPVQDAASLLKLLDQAGIRRGVVLSMGYSFGDERKKLPNPDLQTSAENDWTSQQMVASHGRLIGFCGVNPLRDAALAEIDRCLRLPRMVGIKLHFGNSGISLQNPQQLARMKQLFALANARRAAIVVHLRTRSDQSYSPEEARLFVGQLLPSAPDIVVQIAHLADSGPCFRPDGQAAFDVFASAIERRDPRTRNLIFDETTIPCSQASGEESVAVARAIRRVGVKRVFFGSDMFVADNPSPAEAWALFKAKVPLTPAEFRAIAANVPPYWPR
jgi:predicted TIM-barrel fold metal-dependent hydrolase